jgi:hypothetical protein
MYISGDEELADRLAALSEEAVRPRLERGS